MKISFTLTGLVLLSAASASPFADPNNGFTLDSRGRQPCKWKHDICCKYPSKGKDYDGGNGKSNYNYRRTIRVKSGGCIQHTLDTAKRGDRIIVEAGTYAEQLTIDKDGIDLVGQNAILVPPGTAVQNPCSGLAGPDTQAGICIAGSKLNLDAFKTEHRKVLSVGNPVKDVSVSGFQVNGFPGINIAVVGARNAKVINNKLNDAPAYGVLSAGSVNTIVSGNAVTSAKQSFVGVCTDNFAGAFVSKNTISKQFIGFCVQTSEAMIYNNDVSDCCIGAFVDPGIKGAQIRYNHFGPTSKTGCEAVAAGVFFDGAIKTEVTDNVIEGQKNGGKAAGIIIVDEPCNQPPEEISLSCIVLGHPSVSSDNIVIRNTIRDNDLDIFLNTTGKGNIIQCNDCTTSFPPNLCAA